MIIVVICIILILLLVLLTSVRIDFLYDEKYILKIKYAFFTIYNNEKNVNKKQKKDNNITERSELELKKLKSLASKIKKILSKLHHTAKKQLVIKKFFINYSYGFNDAAITGIYSGLAYAVIYSLIGYIDSNFDLKNKDVIITPDFDNECQKLKFDCTIKIKLFSLLLSGVKILKIWLT